MEEFCGEEGVFELPAQLAAKQQGSGSSGTAFAPLFANLLQLLYDADLVEEAAIYAWAEEKQHADEDEKVFLNKVCNTGGGLAAVLGMCATLVLPELKLGWELAEVARCHWIRMQCIFRGCFSWCLVKHTLQLLPTSTALHLQCHAFVAESFGRSVRVASRAHCLADFGVGLAAVCCMISQCSAFLEWLKTADEDSSGKEESDD
jgi:hypothetical protein